MNDIKIPVDLGLVLPSNEVDSLRNIIKDNKSIWRHLSEYRLDYIDEPLYYIGSPLYAIGYLPKGSFSIYKQFQKLADPFIKVNTIRLQEIVSTELSKIFNKPTLAMRGTSLPGFHVLNGKNKNLDMIFDNYHVDWQLFMAFPEITYPFETFYSYTIVIETSSFGDGLNYYEKSSYENVAYSPETMGPLRPGTVQGVFGENVQLLKYEVGHMYIWRSGMVHKAKDIVFANEDEYRITYQGHCVVTDTEVLYYW